jgi:ABC-type multidrug transport system permease subunit
MIAFVIFTIPNSGSIITAIALILMQGICGLMFGLMISAACPNEIYATTLGIGAFFPSVIIGGIFWPIESMPIGLRYISYILPSTLPIESLRCILLRGWGITYHQVLIGFVVTILWFTFFLINAVNFFMRKL